MMRLIDCHSHCALSGHGQGTVADMVKQARTLGLHTYCMTEHVGLPQQMDPLHEDSVAPEQLLGYRFDVLRLREELGRAGSDMTLVLGAELDWLGADCVQGLRELAPTFEYALGSVHFLEGMPLDNSDDMRLWDMYGVDGVWERYANEWLAMAKSSVGFSAFSHLDLPKVFGSRPSFDVREVYAAMADALVEAHVPFEVNTAGWRKKAAEQYPAEACLKMLIQRKVPVTVGCDAHKPADVAAGVTDAYQLLYQLGARQVVAPTPRTMTDGQWEVLELA